MRSPGADAPRACASIRANATVAVDTAATTATTHTNVAGTVEYSNSPAAPTGGRRHQRTHRQQPRKPPHCSRALIIGRRGRGFVPLLVERAATRALDESLTITPSTAYPTVPEAP
ncbi:hypothetical protein [Rhodococcus sp. LB1]|uniref:hypothetical protein n=1 Tax=Rhodococcus sp. LB1 TaxID=1807499 RepID=UPI00077B2502|nr:hypothetical protein [Rhodococcus sp. LB1]KXX56307.1 hypothetical protein AZG88_15080 [Rhodococcus sp. LB1]